MEVGPNTGLYFTGDTQTGATLYTIYNTTLSSGLQVPTDIGGIEAGTTVASLSGKSIVELFDELLFPTLQPTYTIPEITIDGVSNQTLEVGSTYTPSIDLYGIKNDAGSYTQLRILRNGSPILTDTTLTESAATAIADQFGFVDPNNPNHTYTISPTPYSESYVIPLGSTLYKGDGNYSAGLAKNNSKGVSDARTPAVRDVDAPQAAGTNFETSTYTITGIHPYFWGTSNTLPTTADIASAISGGTANKVVQSSTGTISISYNISDQFIWFAYPSTSTTKTKWFVTTFDSGDIDGSFISTAATQNANSPDGYWSGISFKMHWSVYKTIQNTIEFRNS